MLFPAQSDELHAVTEINITPLIDVMLVLLVIFMVAAPLSTVDMPVDLPASSATPAPRTEDPVVLTITAAGDLLLGAEVVTVDGLRAALASVTRGNADQRIFLAADKATDYAALMAVMDHLRAAGHSKIALVGLEQAGGAP